MTRLSCAAILFVATATVPARAEDLAALLAAASAGARPNATVRGAGELVTRSPDGTVRQRVTVLQRPAGDLYLEVQPPGARALLPAGGAALLAAAPGDAPVPFATDAPLAGSEFSREDLQPFDAARFTSPTIVDHNVRETTVQLDPRDSQYSLVVITFDQDTHAPLKVMSYKDTLSNLLKMRRDRGHVALAGRWLPTEITIENFPMKATSTLTLEWTTVADQPARFDPATFVTTAPLLGQ